MDATRRRACLGALAGLATLLSGRALQTPGLGQGAPAGTPRAIVLQAQKFAYTPNRITFQAGERVVLEITAIDFVHGFSIPDMHIRADLRPGQVTRIALFQPVAGDYPFLCDNFCGIGHEEMGGTIHVV